MSPFSFPLFRSIDRDGVITPDAHVAPWHAQTVAQAIATRGKSYLQGVKDHLISNYIRSLGGQAGSKPTPDAATARTEQH